MKNFDSLPFSLNSESLGAWLDTLAAEQPAFAANQLSQALVLLEKAKAKSKLTLPLLITLTSTVLNITNELCGLNVLKSEQRQTGKFLKFSRLGIKLLKQVSTAFCRVAETPGLSAEETASAIYYALQINGFCLRNYCLLYEIPSASLWKKNAQLYKIAAETGCLHSDLTPFTPEFKLLTKIEDVLKRNLLFNILLPRQFSIDEILELFRLTTRYCDLIDISSSQTGNFYFYWNLEGEEPGPVKGSNKRLPAGFVSIDCLRFAIALQQGAFKTVLKPSSQARLVLHMTAYDTVMNSNRLGNRSSSQLINGLEEICIFLQKYYEIQEQRRFVARLFTNANQRGRHGMQTMSHPSDEQAPFNETFPGKTVALRNTVGKIFVIAEKCPIDCNIGNLCLLYRQHQQQPTLAIIRQKSLQEISGSTLFLLEYIRGEYTIYYPFQGFEAKHVLMVNESSEQPEIFLAPGKYSLDKPINLGGGKIARLTACIEYNSYYCRYRVGFNF